MGKIKVTPCDIKGLYVIEPTVFKDERGYFMETYNQNDFHEAGLDMVFVQDNQSMSVKGVLRGLHYQKQYPRHKVPTLCPQHDISSLLSIFNFYSVYICKLYDTMSQSKN